MDQRAEAPGLEQLLRDFRLPVQAAVPLLEGHSLLLGPAAPVVTYRTVLATLRRARALVQSHLDALFGACLKPSTGAPVQLQEALDAALRRPDQSLLAEELPEALRAAGLDLGAVDLEAVLEALDPYGRGRVYAPELVSGQRAFTQRFRGLLGTLAAGLGRRGLSADELFARASSASASSASFAAAAAAARGGSPLGRRGAAEPATAACF